MSKIDDGGSAFPMTSGDTHTHREGMTLRDYFAGQALAGAIAGGEVRPGDQHYLLNPTWLAERSYKIADAMIAQRGKGASS